MQLWYSILSVLPFEWAQPGQMYFMKHALLAVLVISPLFGILSTMVVHSKIMARVARAAGRAIRKLPLNLSLILQP